MDYDLTAMPAVYDAGRGYTPALMEFWLDAIAAALNEDRFEHILDLGCGTGRYSVALAERFGACVTGVDPSLKMLAEAVRKGGGKVTYMTGAGEAVPLPDASVDLVFISMVLHHFKDPDAAARECLRVVKPMGKVVIRAAVCERIGRYPYVPFFPSAEMILGKALMPVGEVRSLFLRHGFEALSHKVVEAPIAADWREFAHKVSLRADSILAQLDDDEFARGLDELRSHAFVAASGEPVIEPVDLFVFGREYQRNNERDK